MRNRINKLNKLTFQSIIKGKLHNKEYVITHQDRFIYITNVINRYFLKHNNNRILDFGSHTGVLAVILQDYGYNVTSIDLESAIEDNIQTYIQNKLKVDRLTQQWDQLPYEDNYFDSVIFSEVLEHIYESPIAIFFNNSGFSSPKIPATSSGSRFKNNSFVSFV